MGDGDRIVLHEQASEKVILVWGHPSRRALRPSSGWGKQAKTSWWGGANAPSRTMARHV